MTEQLKNQIESLASGYLPETKAIRRHLHAHPELSFEEKLTRQFIGKKLDEYGISWAEVAGTGITGVIRGDLPGKTVALRADMDALPIQETDGREYRSVNDGVMHACGHDVHMACLLSVVRILHQLKEQLPGNVLFFFQPAEEKLPGGALEILKSGILDDPDIIAVIGQHVTPELDAGTAGFKANMLMASVDVITLKVKGKGGHAARPERVIDPIIVSAHILTALQQVVSRSADPTIPTVLSFGYVHGGGESNVIPDEVEIRGTFRTVDESWRYQAHDKIRKIATDLALAYGAECEVIVETGYPCLFNEPNITKRSRDAAEDYLGKENIKDLPLALWSEDFAYYTRKFPGCFYNLGIRNTEKGISSSVHTSTFDIDESVLAHGTGLMAYLAMTLGSDA